MRQRLFAGSATLALLSLPRGYRHSRRLRDPCAAGLAPAEADAEVKRAMLAASVEHWLVADHLKLNRCEPYRSPN